MHAFICRKPAIVHINDQGLANLYRSVYVLYSILFGVVLGSSKAQVGSLNE